MAQATDENAPQLNPRRTYLFGRGVARPTRFRGLRARRVTKENLPRVLSHSRKTDLWIVSNQKAATDILVHIDWKNRPSCGTILLLNDVRATVVEAMEGCFWRVAFAGSHGAALPPEELAEALTAENRVDLAILGAIDVDSRTLTIWRGDLSKIVVPLGAFEGTSEVGAPDFSKFEITDYGQTIKFGEYEAAFDSLLYEFDPRFRRRLKRERERSERGFGPSLRRLRKQRRLSRNDFSPIAAKTIARIERGEVEKPHGRTLSIIAKRLNMAPEDIETF